MKRFINRIKITHLKKIMASITLVSIPIMSTSTTYAEEDPLAKITKVFNGIKSDGVTLLKLAGTVICGIGSVVCGVIFAVIVIKSMWSAHKDNGASGAFDDVSPKAIALGIAGAALALIASAFGFSI